MNNNYNGYYNPYMFTSYQPNIPTPNYTRSVPINPYNGFNNMAAVNGARNSGGLLTRLFPGLSRIGGAAAASSAAPGIVSGATSSGITFSGILNGASRTLGVINQAIPVVAQIKPVWNNAKTMFRVAKAINSNDYEITKKQDKTSSSKTTTDYNIKETKKNTNQPTFFN